MKGLFDDLIANNRQNNKLVSNIVLESQINDFAKYIFLIFCFLTFIYTTILLRWDQNCGRIACSGNVRICRLWDAWAEKSVLDLQLKNKNHFTTSISLDLNCNLICCGMTDYD